MKILYIVFANLNNSKPVIQSKKLALWATATLIKEIVYRFYYTVHFIAEGSVHVSLQQTTCIPLCLCVFLYTEVHNLACSNCYFSDLLEATKKKKKKHTTYIVTDPNNDLTHTATDLHTQARHKHWQTLRCTCMLKVNGWMLKWLVASRHLAHFVVYVKYFYGKLKSKLKTKTTKPQEYSPHCFYKTK